MTQKSALQGVAPPGVAPLVDAAQILTAEVAPRRVGRVQLDGVGRDMLEQDGESRLLEDLDQVDAPGVRGDAPQGASERRRGFEVLHQRSARQHLPQRTWQQTPGTTVVVVHV